MVSYCVCRLRASPIPLRRKRKMVPNEGSVDVEISQAPRQETPEPPTSAERLVQELKDCGFTVHTDGQFVDPYGSLVGPLDRALEFHVQALRSYFDSKKDYRGWTYNQDLKTWSVPVGTSKTYSTSALRTRLQLTRTELYPARASPVSATKRKRAGPDAAESSARYIAVDNIGSQNGKHWAIKAFANKWGDLRCEQSTDGRKDNRYIWNSRICCDPKALAKLLKREKGRDRVRSIYR